MAKQVFLYPLCVALFELSLLNLEVSFYDVFPLYNYVHSIVFAQRPPYRFFVQKNFEVRKKGCRLVPHLTLEKSYIHNLVISIGNCLSSSLHRWLSQSDHLTVSSSYLVLIERSSAPVAKTIGLIR